MENIVGARGRIVCLATVLWAALPGTGWAQKPDNISAGEYALLPPYCVDTLEMQSNSRLVAPGVGAGKWYALMGPSFRHMHHHCWALINERRAMAPGATGFYRIGLLERAIADNHYVIANSTPDFIMLPDVYLKIGDAQQLLKRYALAFDAYAEAVRRKPDYWRPYSHWALAMVEAGNAKGGLSILEEGLRSASNQPPLREQYKRLGGNLDKFLKSLPPPAARSAPAPAESAAPAAPATSAAGA
jgi:tetratricopeptide (TPR) repeat protein